MVRAQSYGIRVRDWTAATGHVESQVRQDEAAEKTWTQFLRRGGVLGDWKSEADSRFDGRLGLKWVGRSFAIE